MAGGHPRPVRLCPPSSPADPRWRLDADELRAAFGPKTRALVLNSPQNPAGKVFARDELELIAQLCREHDVLAITDEVYDRLVFQGEHIPLASLPGMRERTITINSTGKTFSVNKSPALLPAVAWRTIMSIRRLPAGIAVNAEESAGYCRIVRTIS